MTRRARPVVSAASVVAVLVFVAACRSKDPLPLGPTTTSPQAAAEPAPLEHSPGRMDDAKDSPRLFAPESDAATEAPSAEGVALAYELQWGEGSFAARMGDTPTATLDTLRRRSATTLQVVASGSRAAFVIAGPRTLVPPGLEVRAQADHHGYAIVENADKRYMEAPDGVWRALVGDGRLDVSPLRLVEVPELPAKGATTGDRTLTLTTKSATLVLTIAAGDAGSWGAAVARVIAELAGMATDGPILADGEWPKRAEIQWSNGRSLRFAGAAKAARLVEASEVVAAPFGYRLERRALVAPSSRAFLGPADLAMMHGSPSDGPPGEGSTLWLVNRDVAPRVVLIEGVPAGWIAGNQSLALEGLRPGRYALRWLSPLGELDSGDGVAAAPGVVSLRGGVTP